MRYMLILIFVTPLLCFGDFGKPRGHVLIGPDEEPVIPRAEIDEEIVQGRPLPEVFSLKGKRYHCIVKNMEKRSVKKRKGFGRSYWYISDGSCLLKTGDLEKSFAAMRRMMLTPERMPQHNGGVSQMLEFIKVDGAGVPVEIQGLDVSNPLTEYNAFFGMKGLSSKLLPKGYEFFIHVEPKDTVIPNGKDFALRFYTDPNKYPFPKYLKDEKTRPELYFYDEEGIAVTVKNPDRLENVMGMWHFRLLNPDSTGESYIYLRYYNAVDLDMNINNTLLTFSAKSTYAIHGKTLRRLVEEAFGDDF